jgi:hypothetical protein
MVVGWRAMEAMTPILLRGCDNDVGERVFRERLFVAPSE